MPSHRDCARTTLALPWLLNGTLPTASRRAVREHLIACPACRAEMAKTRETLALFSASERVDATRKGASILPFGRARRLAGRPAFWATAAALAVAVLGSLFVERRSDETPIAGSSPAPRKIEAAAAGPTLLYRDGFDAGKLDRWTVQSNSEAKVNNRSSLERSHA